MASRLVASNCLATLKSVGRVEVLGGGEEFAFVGTLCRGKHVCQTRCGGNRCVKASHRFLRRALATQPKAAKPTLPPTQPAQTSAHRRPAPPHCRRGAIWCTEHHAQENATQARPRRHPQSVPTTSKHEAAGDQEDDEAPHSTSFSSIFSLEKVHEITLGLFLAWIPAKRLSHALLRRPCLIVCAGSGASALAHTLAQPPPPRAGHY